MNLLFPKIPLRRLGGMLRLAFLGAVIAGAYGTLHDQVSYSISPEYFTKMKFQQFDYADFGAPPRVFVAEVGFLATWWAGLFTGWFLARSGLDLLPPNERRRRTIRAFAIAFAAAVLAGAGAAGIAFLRTRQGVTGWDSWRERLDLHDLRGFVIVAWLHAGGYLGAFVGLVAAIVDLRRAIRVKERVGAPSAACADG